MSEQESYRQAGFSEAMRQRAWHTGAAGMTFPMDACKGALQVSGLQICLFSVMSSAAATLLFFWQSKGGEPVLLLLGPIILFTRLLFISFQPLIIFLQNFTQQNARNVSCLLLGTMVFFLE